MKVILDETILEIGSAGLRCGRWAVKHKEDKKPTTAWMVGYHQGKCYAYLYTLSLMGLVEFLNPSVILDVKNFIPKYGKGKIWCFKDDWKEPIMLMNAKLFEAIMTSKQPHQGKIITKEIRKMCPKI